MSLDDHGKEERDHHGFHHYIGEHEGLHHGIDGLSARRNIGKDRRCASNSISDAKQKDIGGTLQDRQADHGMYEMSAADQAIQSAEK